MSVTIEDTVKGVANAFDVITDLVNTCEGVVQSVAESGISGLTTLSSSQLITEVAKRVGAAREALVEELDDGLLSEIIGSLENLVEDQPILRAIGGLFSFEESLFSL